MKQYNLDGYPLSARGNLKEVGFGFEPELATIDNPADPDWEEPDPLLDWLETDNLTLVIHGQVTTLGSLVENQLCDLNEI